MTVDGALVDALLLVALLEVALFSVDDSPLAVLLLKLDRRAQLGRAVGPLAANFEVSCVSIPANAAVTVTIAHVIILFGPSFVVPVGLHDAQTLL